MGIAVNSQEDIYVADYGNDRIQKFTSKEEFIRAWGSTGTSDGQFRGIYGIAVDSNDDIYVTDVANHRIQKFDINGNFITKWGSPGTDQVNSDIHWV